MILVYLVIFAVILYCSESKQIKRSLQKGGVDPTVAVGGVIVFAVLVGLLIWFLMSDKSSPTPALTTKPSHRGQHHGHMGSPPSDTPPSDTPPSHTPPSDTPPHVVVQRRNPHKCMHLISEIQKYCKDVKQYNSGRFYNGQVCSPQCLDRISLLDDILRNPSHDCYQYLVKTMGGYNLAINLTKYNKDVCQKSRRS